MIQYNTNILLMMNQGACVDARESPKSPVKKNKLMISKHRAFRIYIKAVAPYSQMRISWFL